MKYNKQQTKWRQAMAKYIAESPEFRAGCMNGTINAEELYKKFGMVAIVSGTSVINTLIEDAEKAGIETTETIQIKDNIHLMKEYE